MTAPHTWWNLSGHNEEAREETECHCFPDSIIDVFGNVLTVHYLTGREIAKCGFWRCRIILVEGPMEEQNGTW